MEEVNLANGMRRFATRWRRSHCFCFARRVSVVALTVSASRVLERIHICFKPHLISRVGSQVAGMTAQMFWMSQVCTQQHKLSFGSRDAPLKKSSLPH